MMEVKRVMEVMEMRRFFACIVALCLGVCAFGQGVTAIKAGRLIDVKAGKVLTNQVILVRGTMIEQVGPDVKIPDGAKVIDLSDSTVMPGLIDCHTHLLTEFDNKIGFDDVNGNLTIFAMSTTERALLGAKNARECLEAGITMVRDLGNSGTNGDVALRDAINKGWLPGPRILASTRALSGPGGQFGRLPKESQHMVSVEYAEISGVEEARKAVRKAIQDGADLIKVIVDSYLTVSTEEMKVIVEEAHRAGRKVAAHAISPLALKAATEAGVDSIEHAYNALPEPFEAMAKKRIFLVPTDVPTASFIDGRRLTPEELKSDEAGNRQFESQRRGRIELAKRLGVRIAFGSDMYYAWPPRTRGQASIASLCEYVKESLTPMETIQAATINAADLCGWGGRLGEVAPRMLASIVAVKGDPLQDINLLEKVSFVMKEGTVVK